MAGGGAAACPAARASANACTSSTAALLRAGMGEAQLFGVTATTFAAAARARSRVCTVSIWRCLLPAGRAAGVLVATASAPRAIGSSVPCGHVRLVILLLLLLLPLLVGSWLVRHAAHAGTQAEPGRRWLLLRHTRLVLGH
jgi:hypothetical protein